MPTIHPKKTLLKICIALIVILFISVIIGELHNKNYKFPDPPFRHPAIPEHVTDAAMDLAVARFTVSFNEQNYGELYERFDPIGKSIYANENFEEKYREIYSKFGPIGKRAFGGAYISEKLSDGSSQYQLVYKVELKNTDFKLGKLTLLVADRGDHLSLIRVLLSGVKE